MHWSVETPTPPGKGQDPGQIKGFDKPKAPAPGENLEIKFPSPWEQIGKGLKKKQTNQNKKKPLTLNLSGTKYTLIRQ